MCGLVGRLAASAVVVAFGGHALFPVLRPGAAAFGHHRGPFAAIVLGWFGFDGGHTAHGVTQAGEQQGAARNGDMGVPGR